jgi:hypothetical protein
MQENRKKKIKKMLPSFADSQLSAKLDKFFSRA